jgi:hypothetical protein
MALKQYLPALPTLINGVSQVELQEVTLTFDPAKTVVETKNGLAGFSSGPKKITIEYKSAVPVSGPEFNAINAAEGNEAYTMQTVIGGQTVVSEGQFTGASISTSTGSAVDTSGSFTGTYNPTK